MIGDAVEPGYPSGNPSSETLAVWRLCPNALYTVIAYPDGCAASVIPRTVFHRVPFFVQINCMDHTACNQGGLGWGDGGRYKHTTLNKASLEKSYERQLKILPRIGFNFYVGICMRKAQQGPEGLVLNYVKLPP